jgi:4a-hydroxytetrahydrobiopterin dehydratase
VDFITRVAHESETMNHHPDLLLLWRKVTVRLCTHSSGGITVLDIALAMKIEQLAGVGGK